MKKFFRDSCIYNVGGIAAFVMVSVYLFIVWRLISSGSLIAQILAVVWLLYFLCSALIGAVILLVDVIRKIIAKGKSGSVPVETEKNSAP